MNTHERNPRWWSLYLMLPVVAGLFWLESRAPLTRSGHQVAQISILLVLVSYALVWLRVESVPLMRQSIRDASRFGDPYRIIEDDKGLSVDWSRREATGVLPDGGQAKAASSGQERVVR